MMANRKKPIPDLPIPMTGRWNDRLWWLMEINGVTSEQLGDAIGKSKWTIYDYIEHTRRLDANVIKAIADYFGCTTDFLLCRTSEVGNANKDHQRNRKDKPTD